MGVDVGAGVAGSDLGLGLGVDVDVDVLEAMRVADGKKAKHAIMKEVGGWVGGGGLVPGQSTRL